jgi:hypothetical protein
MLNNPLPGHRVGSLPSIAIIVKPIFYPEIRKIITRGFVETIKEKFPEAEVIAGVATGAIVMEHCCRSHELTLCVCSQ